jgi:hypothetical protein
METVAYVRVLVWESCALTGPQSIKPSSFPPTWAALATKVSEMASTKAPTNPTPSSSFFNVTLHQVTSILLPPQPASLTNHGQPFPPDLPPRYPQTFPLHQEISTLLPLQSASRDQSIPRPPNNHYARSFGLQHSEKQQKQQSNC